VVLPLFVPFIAFMIFFLLDDHLKIFIGFCSSSCASWALEFELQTLCLVLSMDLSSERLETKLSIP
jgi:hypothetical protein